MIKGNERWLKVSGTKQQVDLMQGKQSIVSYPVSTAVAGFGCNEGSLQTPTGWHEIDELIGANAPSNAVFVGRVPTGEIYSDSLCNLHPERDWILSRIIRLSGLEQGVNLGVSAEGVCVDSKDRFIYFHGTPDSEPMGSPASHGCIRMRNNQVIELFDQVQIGDKVLIEP